MTTPSASKPVLLDSSGWLEYITEDSKADLFAPYLQAQDPVLVPSIVLYEVRKILLLRKGKLEADRFVSQALRHQIVDLDDLLAIAASEVSLTHKLSMADAIIYATAQVHEAQLITSDPHFSELPGVTLI